MVLVEMVVLIKAPLRVSSAITKQLKPGGSYQVDSLF